MHMLALQFNVFLAILIFITLLSFVIGEDSSIQRYSPVDRDAIASGFLRATAGLLSLPVDFIVTALIESYNSLSDITYRPQVVVDATDLSSEAVHRLQLIKTFIDAEVAAKRKTVLPNQVSWLNSGNSEISTSTKQRPNNNIRGQIPVHPSLDFEETHNEKLPFIVILNSQLLPKSSAEPTQQLEGFHESLQVLTPTTVNGENETVYRDELKKLDKAKEYVLLVEEDEDHAEEFEDLFDSLAHVIRTKPYSEDDDEDIEEESYGIEPSENNAFHLNQDNIVAVTSDLDVTLNSKNRQSTSRKPQHYSYNRIPIIVRKANNSKNKVGFIRPAIFVGPPKMLLEALSPITSTDNSDKYNTRDNSPFWIKNKDKNKKFVDLTTAQTSV